MTTSATAEFANAQANNLDAWVPASGGTETPFNTRTGDRMLYCYNPNTGKHAYLDLGSDMIVADNDLHAYGLS